MPVPIPAEALKIRMCIERKELQKRNVEESIPWRRMHLYQMSLCWRLHRRELNWVFWNELNRFRIFLLSV
ncbi:hypothetical protein AAES_61965 [Amazona aestiva]|uniref:Uncharacterized protein n=1 Tax=Amazona aestiva TaxID=12930 RepID=A0A0Q3Q4N7_AMAAE|nr:hypothetical protein AAES_61965 [Amazona aestiva]